MTSCPTQQSSAGLLLDKSSNWCWDGVCLVLHETLLMLCTGAGTLRTCSSEVWTGGKYTGASGQSSSFCSAKPACSTSPLESWTAAAATHNCQCTPAGSDQARTQQCLPACIWQPGLMLPGLSKRTVPLGLMLMPRVHAASAFA